MSKALNEMSYEDFGKLRFLDFFPKTKAYYVDDSGGMVSQIGLAQFEGYGPAGGFASKTKLKGATCGITLDFENGIPESQAHRLLENLGLPLRRGMLAKELKIVMGKPLQLGVPAQTGYDWFRWVIGSRWRYYVEGPCYRTSGLARVDILRADLVDDEAKRTAVR
jgi:hypothetical protein